MIPTSVFAIRLAIPIKELIKNSDLYLNLGGTTKYFRNLREKIANCSSPEQIFEILKEKTVQKEIQRSQYNKIMASLNELFKEKIVDIQLSELYKTGPPTPIINVRSKNSEVQMELETNEIFPALMKLGFIPVLMTGHLVGEHYAPTIQTWQFKVIEDAQGKNPKDILLAFPELQTVTIQKRANSAIAKDKLRDLISRGRLKKIHLIYDTQNYNDIPESIRMNTSFLFCFHTGSEKAVNAIKEDFGLDRESANEIKDLGKLECIALSRGEYFIAYDIESKRKFKITGNTPLRGKILPPLSKHKSPTKPK